MNVTHEITSMVRKVNKHGDPMWECQCKDGAKVWVNKHIDPLKDKFVYFVAAGFEPVMAAMTEGQRIEWRQFPIQVEMTKDGDFWRLLAVAERAAGQMFDVPYAPKPEFWRKKAVVTAINLMESSAHSTISWDTETTGYDGDAEIISIGIVNRWFGEKANWLIRPSKLERVTLTTGVHAIAAENLENAAAFPVLHEKIEFVLSDEIWVGYNIKFDIQMLDQECERHDLPAILPGGVFDVMELVAWYRGEWDEANARWKVCRLTEAAEALGVEYHGEAHDALNDAITTMKLVRKMAGV